MSAIIPLVLFSLSSHSGTLDMHTLKYLILIFECFVQSCYFCFVFFFLWERERESIWAGRGFEGEEDRESQADSPLSMEPDTGFDLMSLRSWPWDHDLSWNQEPNLNPLSHPGAPISILYVFSLALVWGVLLTTSGLVLPDWNEFLLKQTLKFLKICRSLSFITFHLNFLSGN